MVGGPFFSSYPVELLSKKYEVWSGKVYTVNCYIHLTAAIQLIDVFKKMAISIVDQCFQKALSSLAHFKLQCNLNRALK